MKSILFRERRGVPCDAWQIVREGRRALSEERRHRRSSLHPTDGPIARLLLLLWHEDRALRQAAALALAGGDAETAYSPCYGHFAGTLLRALPGEADSDTFASRHQAVIGALRRLLAQNADEIRAMSNMSYSFLGGALYLALLSTCRDGVEAARRLRATGAHPELCRLLWHLSLAGHTGRLNSMDVDALMQLTGRALAALPPDEIPEFWNHLRHRAHARRKAVTPALNHFVDSRAVPHLTEGLSAQPPDIAESIIACLGRMGDPHALPALGSLLTHRHRETRRKAQAAISAIERTIGTQSRTLLRPVMTMQSEVATTLLRSLPQDAPADPPEQLLRISSAPGENG